MAKKNLVITQGSTFSMAVRWEQPDFTFKAVSSVTNAAPPVVTALNHGIPDNWRVAFTNVGGMDELNAEDAELIASVDFFDVDYVDANSFKLKNVDATGYGVYTSGGIVRYHAPVLLAGYTARLQCRQTLTAASTLFELTTENGGILLDQTNYVITLLLSAAATALFNFTSGVYSLEMINGNGAVTQLLEGTVKLNKEVTR
jgi:hypothetical protein